MTYPKSRMEFVDMISKQFEENPDYENVNIIMGVDGLMVEYDHKQAPEPDPALVEQLKTILKGCVITGIPELASRHQSEFIPFPEIERKLPIQLF